MTDKQSDDILRSAGVLEDDPSLTDEQIRRVIAFRLKEMLTVAERLRGDIHTNSSSHLAQERTVEAMIVRLNRLTHKFDLMERKR